MFNPLLSSYINTVKIIPQNSAKVYTKALEFQQKMILYQTNTVSSNQCNNKDVRQTFSLPDGLAESQGFEPWAL